MGKSGASAYHYHDAGLGQHHAYLLPVVLRELAARSWGAGPRRVFDLGCGNGAIAAKLAASGYDVSGIDASHEGIEHARAAYPGLRVAVGSAYDDLATAHGRSPAVVSLEVIEHLYDPRTFARRLQDLLEPGGVALVSTPYHGYLKNVAIAVAGKTDQHVNPLWDHGHIKFWSRETLRALFAEVGLRVARFHRVGRFPALAKSMVAVVER